MREIEFKLLFVKQLRRVVLMRFVLLKSLSNDTLENGAHEDISIINVVDFQKMCLAARERILPQNSIGLMLEVLKYRCA